MTIFSALVGWAAPNLIPRKWTHHITTFLFFGFGLWSLWDAFHEGEAEEYAEVEAKLAFSITFFGEWGDKRQDDDEADPVGCCTLKVENVEIAPPSTLKCDFLGKDSIRYKNDVEVEPAVFRAIKQFRKGKKGSEDLFAMLDTSTLNAHLKQLMDGLTTKVFQTYNASITSDDMLSKETKAGDVAEKVVVYNGANKEVAIICNHQRTVSKAHSAQMTRLDDKIDELKGSMRARSAE